MYPSEHAARLLDPATEHIRVRRTRGSGSGKVQGVTIPNNISVIWFVKKVDNKEVPTAQSLRFPKSSWTEDKAREWIKTNKIKVVEFEPALKENVEDKIPCWNAWIKEIEFLDETEDTDKKKKTCLNILIHDFVGFSDTESKNFKKLLDDNRDVKQIMVDINSPGGNVSDGFSIYNSLKEHPAEVHVKVSGVAASIASVIAMAADKIEMPENSMMMIHKPIIPFLGSSNADDLRHHAETLDKFEEGILASYRPRMKKYNDTEISTMLKNQTWFTAAEALDAGLCDEISEEVDLLDFHDFSKFSYKGVPDNVLNVFSVDHGPACDFEFPEDEKKSLVQAIREILTKEFNLFQRGNTMPDNANETRISALEKEISDLKASNAKLSADLATATTASQNAAAQLAAKAKDTRTAEFKVFCDSLVAEGKIRPVDVPIHLENMEFRYNEKDSKALDTYKASMKELPKLVDVSGNHFASNANAQLGAKNDATYDARAKELMAEAHKAGRNLSVKDALRMAYQEKR